ncbi:Type I inositol-3,4-bisphosphate 4-phosphatase [Operophtera brumata]|uniref:Type I inositol-3,4-bisphosphate 4-phosphatase n=1 Tax=Operophtera brumata TaxID=104452 RepID=A0A0L7L4G8_OPEBR|nr:Type I inositol-3,4-bisphosphate 4-phosphatase [Operophtera brumata]
MRYNKQELFALASQTSQSFDREGVLVLKERQDSFFRRSEGCSVRWFRLRGNLLFYLKGPEPWYEPLGVIVLGNHQVSVQSQDENGHWPFQIVWENGFCYRMATFLECERTLWLKAMEAAPYEQIVRRIANLYHQLDETRTLIDLRRHRTINKIINDFNEVPLCELSLSCDNLLCDANGNPPSPFAAVFVLFPEKEFFSRTVMFRGSDGITSDVLVRIVVFDVCEPFTQTGVAMGSVTMRLSHIQVSILPHGDVPRQRRHHERRAGAHRGFRRSLPPRLGLKLKYPSYGALLRHSFVNPHQATYRFQSGLGGDITIFALARPPIKTDDTRQVGASSR